MPALDTRAVASLLREYAQRSALRGGNPYRAKAYARAADSLASLAIPLDRLIADGRLTEIPGIGEAIADIVTKLHRRALTQDLRSSGARSRQAYWSCLRSRASAPRR